MTEDCEEVWSLLIATGGTLVENHCIRLIRILRLFATESMHNVEKLRVKVHLFRTKTARHQYQVKNVCANTTFAERKKSISHKAEPFIAINNLVNDKIPVL